MPGQGQGLTVENCFLHTWQQYVFSAVCVRMRLGRSLAVEILFPHSWQKFLSPSLTFMCLVQYEFIAKRFLHGKHKNSFVSRAFSSA